MRTILIFAKAPVPGRAKTRLALGLGTKKAAKLSKWMTMKTYAVARTVKGVRLHVAYEPYRSAKTPNWMAFDAKLSWFHQTGANLGERLIHAFEYAFAEEQGPVLAIGSDLPTLTPALLRAAFAALKRVPLVIGPSRDGGYYLIGLRQPRPELFRQVAWSTSRVLKQTLAAAKKRNIAYRLLPIHQDVDTISDLQSLLC